MGSKVIHGLFVIIRWNLLFVVKICIIGNSTYVLWWIFRDLNERILGYWKQVTPKVILGSSEVTDPKWSRYHNWSLYPHTMMDFQGLGQTDIGVGDLWLSRVMHVISLHAFKLTLLQSGCWCVSILISIYWYLASSNISKASQNRCSTTCILLVWNSHKTVLSS